MSKKKNQEQFVNEVYSVFGNEYVVLGTYGGMKTKVKVKHNKCNKEYYTNPSDFIRGHGCPYCSGRFKKTIEQFKREVYNLIKNEYTILGEYNGNKNKILIKHNECNREFKMQPLSFLQGQRCPHCAGHMRKTTEQFKKEIYDLVGDEYSSIEEYKGVHTLILMRHNKCATEYKVTPHNFLSGNRCPTCSESMGEKKIKEILNNEKVIYKKQYWFKDLKHICPLRFDFAIFNLDNTLNCLIEYDGEFHYKNFKLGNNLELQQYKDKLKTDYCLNNNIKLIRIPYWEKENIEIILKEKLFIF